MRVLCWLLAKLKTRMPHRIRRTAAGTVRGPPSHTTGTAPFASAFAWSQRADGKNISAGTKLEKHQKKIKIDHCKKNIQFVVSCNGDTDKISTQQAWKRRAAVSVLARQALFVTFKQGWRREESSKVNKHMHFKIIAVSLFVYLSSFPALGLSSSSTTMPQFPKHMVIGRSRCPSASARLPVYTLCSVLCLLVPHHQNNPSDLNKRYI